jgi:hypothetical protein
VGIIRHKGGIIEMDEVVPQRGQEYPRHQQEQQQAHKTRWAR